MIAIDARYVRERPSGIGAMVEALIARVPGLLPQERFLLLKHPRAPARLSESPNVREVTVRAEANGPVTLLALPAAVDLRGVELFHATFNLLPRGLRMATLVTIHDVMWLESPEFCRSPGLWGRVETRFYRSGITHALERATEILSVSRATAAAIAEIHPAAGERTKVVPHGLDPDFRPAVTESERREVAEAQRRHAPGAARYVLTVGQGAAYKNHPRVVEGFVEAFRGEPSTHLLLVQRLGEGARALLQIARERGAEGRVHILPAVPRRDLVALYRGALCLCHPSLVEGWGMPVGEALGAGCPVVTSSSSSMPEVAGEAAVYVEDPRSVRAIAAALARVGADASLRERLVRVGLERARLFTWDEAARTTAGVYARLLADARRRRR